MRVLIGCERSGAVRDAFFALGYDAYSCDLEPCEGSGLRHIQMDVLRCIVERGPWDIVIVHPPCTYLSVSGLHWNGRVPGRKEKTEAALAFVGQLFKASEQVKHFCLENPVSCISTAFRKPDQVIQPYQFGHDASKSTCLWLKNLPKLRPTKFVEPRMVNGRPRWANQTDSGQNRLGPSATRAIDRARTYEGIANAMASQWDMEAF